MGIDTAKESCSSSAVIATKGHFFTGTFTGAALLHMLMVLTMRYITVIIEMESP
jgi:hypothetical protein